MLMGDDILIIKALAEKLYWLEFYHGSAKRLWRRGHHNKKDKVQTIRCSNSYDIMQKETKN